MRLNVFLHREVEFIPILGGRIDLVEINQKILEVNHDRRS